MITGAKINSWDASMIRKLSCDYTTQLNDRDVNAPPPYDANPPTREEIGSKLKDALKMLRK